jgi:hypothetical protein
MNEIWMPECVAAGFFFLYLVRPFIKGLWALDGLVWLPLLGLGIAIGLFPAYGFRPECIPFLVFASVCNCINVSALMFSATSRRNDDFRDWNPFCTILALGFLLASFFVMVAFPPAIPSALVSDGVESKKIHNKARNRDYFVRVYGPVPAAGVSPDSEPVNGGIRPLIFLIPPEAGSISAVDRVCAGLRDRGFTVVSYSRRGFDLPATGENGRRHGRRQGRRYRVSLARLNALWRAFQDGTVFTKANVQGAALEAERMEDIAFLLPRIPALAEQAADPELAEKTPLLLAGYGAGGSALTLFAAADGEFSSRFSNVKGIVTVESRFWSMYRSEPPVFPALPNRAPWHLRLKRAVTQWLSGFKRQRVTGFGEFPWPGVPVLCLVSDRAMAFSGGAEGPLGDNPYRALLETLRDSSGPAALVAIKGAGPLDYCDYPLSHPLYSFMFPGAEKNAAQGAALPADTASIICNFAVMALGRETAALTGGTDGDGFAAATEPPALAAPEPPLAMPAQRGTNADVYVETWGLPDFMP